MGIDLALCLTPRRAPGPRDPGDRVVAWARGFVPAAWWLLFSAGDAVLGPEGLALVTPSEAALERLRHRGPELRAAAGRHALGLRVLEAELAGAPSRFLRAELHELYPTGADVPALGHRDPFEPWPSRLDRGRLVAGDHGGTLADALVGRVADTTVALPDAATLDTRSVAALRAGDAAELDLLEEALARPLTTSLAPWLPMTRRRWGDGDAGVPAAQVVKALAEGRPDPFAPLAHTPPHFAAHALAHAAGRDRERRRALRSALRGATAPLAAPLALALGLACPSLDALLVAEWLDGGPPPRTVGSVEAVLACRLAAVGAPEWPLSLHDPIAVVERALGWRDLALRPAEPFAGNAAPDLAVERGLRLSAAAARAWLPDGATDPDQSHAAGSAAAALCRSALAIDPATRAALRDLPAPADPFLAGADRACVRLALGDLDVLPPLLADPGAPALALVAALRSAGVAERALGWLAERAESGDFAAAALLLDTPSADARAATAARSTATPALRRLVEIQAHFDEGLATTAERDAVLDELSALARALGAEGAALRRALADAG